MAMVFTYAMGKDMKVSFSTTKGMVMGHKSLDLIACLGSTQAIEKMENFRDMVLWSIRMEIDIRGSLVMDWKMDLEFSMMWMVGSIMMFGKMVYLRGRQPSINGQLRINYIISLINENLYIFDIISILEKFILSIEWKCAI